MQFAVPASKTTKKASPQPAGSLHGGLLAASHGIPSRHLSRKNPPFGVTYNHKKSESVSNDLEVKSQATAVLLVNLPVLSLRKVTIEFLIPQAS